MHTSFNINTHENAIEISLLQFYFNEEVWNEIEPQVEMAIEKRRSIILNCKLVNEASEWVIGKLIKLHERCYNDVQLSLVLCETKQCEQLNRLNDELNITPTFQEALDIVNMEVIERELLG